jgi:hypothetical protein
MTIIDALEELNKRGFCLWVGAGIGLTISSETKSKVPSWKALVDDLEKEFKVCTPDFMATLPERLEVVKRVSTSYNFKQKLRELILKPMCHSILEHVEMGDGGVPKCIELISRIGLISNPIINFNVESITSKILCAGGGHYTIKSFGKLTEKENFNINNSTKYTSSDGKMIGRRFKRSIYHPHGYLSGYSTTIFSEQEYNKLSNSLAFQLATHSAFDEILVILGMSLDDQYLRNQLTLFRSEIRRILWFQKKGDISSDVKAWCWSNNIEIIDVHSWFDFWNGVDQVFAQVEKEDLNEMWCNLVVECISNINESFEAERRIERFIELRNGEVVLREKYKLIDKGIKFSEQLNTPPVISACYEKDIKVKVLCATSP